MGGLVNEANEIKRACDLLASAHDPSHAVTKFQGQSSGFILCITRDKQMCKNFNLLIAQGTSFRLAEILDFLHSFPKAAKRIWVPDEGGGFREVSDRAVPMWWIRQELGKLGVRVDGEKEG